VEKTGHKQTSERVEFCRVPNCEQTEYRSQCPVSWKFEAHHLLCVSYVNSAIEEKAENNESLEEVINESEWCINNELNMIALPVWGTTVMWYCNDFSGIQKGASLLQELSTLLISKTAEPPFKNLPQHNYQHSGGSPETSYNREIEDALHDLLDGVEMQVEKHAISGPAVGKKFDDLSKKMRKKLKDRGERVGSLEGGGTHKAWLNPGRNWYEPFSMAQVATPIPFPEKAGDKMVEKIKKIAKAFWSA
jgi:hypothetical protein